MIVWNGSQYFFWDTLYVDAKYILVLISIISVPHSSYSLGLEEEFMQLQLSEVSDSSRFSEWFAWTGGGDERQCQFQPMRAQQ